MSRDILQWTLERYGPAGRSTCCPPRGRWIQFLGPTWQLATICNFHSRGWIPFPLLTSMGTMNTGCRYIQAKIHTYKTKISTSLNGKKCYTSRLSGGGVFTTVIPICVMTETLTKSLQCGLILSLPHLQYPLHIYNNAGQRFSLSSSPYKFSVLTKLSWWIIPYPFLFVSGFLDSFIH